MIRKINDLILIADENGRMLSYTVYPNRGWAIYSGFRPG